MTVLEYHRSRYYSVYLQVMTNLGQSLPYSLVQRMNDDREIDTFQAWYRGYYERTMGTALLIQPVYDKQTYSFVQELELM